MTNPTELSHLDERLSRGAGTSILNRLAVVLTALALGFLVLALGQAEMRWTVYGLGTVFLGMGMMTFGIRRALLAYFILALTVDAHYYLTPPPPALSVGVTSPGALSIPLVLIPGTLLLSLQRLMDRAGSVRFEWFPEISRPVLWTFATLTTSLLASPLMRFAGFTLLWENAALYCLFLIVANVIRARDDVYRLIPLLQVALAGQFAAFFLQLATGVKFNAVGKIMATGESLLHSASGTVAETTAGFATFVEPLILICYVEFRTRKPGRSRMIAGALFILGTIVVALTLNRSSWIGFPIGLLTAEILMRRRNLVAGTPAASRRLLIGMGTVALAFTLAFPLFQSARNAHHAEDAEQRFDLMGPARSMILHNPVFGVGPGAYAYHVREYAGGYKGWLYVVHNDYLLIWAERGTFGILAWLALMRAIGRTMNRATHVRDQRLAGLAVGSVAGFVVHLWEIFWTQFMPLPVYGVIYILTGVCIAVSHMDQAGTPDPSPDGLQPPPPALGP